VGRSLLPFSPSNLDLGTARPLTVEVGSAERVSGLLQVPGNAQICYVFAHGAGAGMEHPFMTMVADGLGGRGIATLRYQFPYMERGSRRPDPPEIAPCDGARGGRRNFTARA
jgi:predicted alpha/beta-hydrolase family hydrolase